jgi:hypothetical protein
MNLSGIPEKQRGSMNYFIAAGGSASRNDPHDFARAIPPTLPMLSLPYAFSVWISHE